MICEHATLDFELSNHADIVGYQRPTTQQRASAIASATTRKKKDVSDEGGFIPSSMFPAPLVLPNDALTLDPRCPPQSLRSWLCLKDRNEVTADKNVIYVAAPPDIGSDVQFMQAWSRPEKEGKSGSATPPRIEDIVDYLKAFYHGLSVKLLPPPKLCFASWDPTPTPKRSKLKSTKSTIPPYIGLNTQTECVRLRTRPSSDSIFAAQLNLDDLLDAAISMLPKDAYALLLLVNHDLFEDDDDAFVCGRSYGGSRVAVISAARYNPLLDQSQDVERVHAWPASHCESYVHACCEMTVPSRERPKKKVKLQKVETNHSQLPPPISSIPDEPTSPMLQAVSAHKALPSLNSSSSLKSLSGLWLGRVCRTASHELGHCFGMEHCVYYACVMQSSSSLAEDARQPPYLCPIDLAKMLHASGSTADARYRALLSFCNQHLDVHLFAAFAAWIRGRLELDYS